MMKYLYLGLKHVVLRNHESLSYNNFNFNAPATVTSESELFLSSNTSNEIISSNTLILYYITIQGLPQLMLLQLLKMYL